MQFTGGCLCGAVRYESKAPPVVTRTCWCRLCQYHGTTSDFMSIATDLPRVERQPPPATA